MVRYTLTNVTEEDNRRLYNAILMIEGNSTDSEGKFVLTPEITEMNGAHGTGIWCMGEQAWRMIVWEVLRQANIGIEYAQDGITALDQDESPEHAVLAYYDIEGAMQSSVQYINLFGRIVTMLNGQGQ
jgi:hypothetical protein